MSCHTCPHIPCPNLYMMSGTVTKRKYFNIRAIYESLPAGSVSAILPFDALTGCDTTSFICNHSNSLDSIPKAPHNSFLTQRGRTNQSKKMKEVEKFACKMYKLDSFRSVDEARPILFSKKGKPEPLPPTSDALSLQCIKCVHYQANTWKHAHCSEPYLRDPET